MRHTIHVIQPFHQVSWTVCLTVLVLHYRTLFHRHWIGWHHPFLYIHHPFLSFYHQYLCYHHHLACVQLQFRTGRFHGLNPLRLSQLGHHNLKWSFASCWSRSVPDCYLYILDLFNIMLACGTSGLRLTTDCPDGEELK